MGEYAEYVLDSSANGDLCLHNNWLVCSRGSLERPQSFLFSSWKRWHWREEEMTVVSCHCVCLLLFLCVCCPNLDVQNHSLNHYYFGWNFSSKSVVFRQLKDSIHIFHYLYATNVPVYDRVSACREIILKWRMQYFWKKLNKTNKIPRSRDSYFWMY